MPPLPVSRRATLAAVLVSAVVAACGAKGSGHRRTESRPVGAFTEVRVEGFIDLEIAHGATPALDLEADDNLLPRITSSVAAGRLTLDTEGSMVTSASPVARVTTPGVNRVIAEGSGSLKLTGATGARLEIELAGSRDATLEGTVDELVLRLSGATKIDARKLAAKKVTIDASGASSVELGSPAALEAKASGSSRIRYDGTPAVTRDVSGSSSIEAR